MVQRSRRVRQLVIEGVGARVMSRDNGVRGYIRCSKYS
jgi:hypothetical protein